MTTNLEPEPVSTAHESPAHYGAAVFAVVAVATAAGHEVGDYLEQSQDVSERKHSPGAEGRRALHRHIAGLTGVQLAFTVGALRACGLRVPLRAILAGQAINSVTHWLIDRGPFLRWWAAATGKADHEARSGFYYAGDGTPMSGRALCDQAFHKGLIVIAAGVTAYLARKSVSNTSSKSL